MERDAFYLRAARALSACQLVEQELKLYVTEAFNLVRKKLAGELPFLFSGEQYENSSLERLIDTFARLNNNDSLVADLRRLKDERNHLSHRAIALCINPDGEFDEGTAHALEPRLAAIEQEAERVRREIQEAEGRVMANLYFDEIPPDAG